MKKILIGSVVSMFALMGASSAFAAWSTGPANVTTVLTQAKAAETAAVKAATDVVYTLTETLATNDTVTINLTGGATFAVVPTLTPSVSDMGNGYNAPAKPLTGGTVGSTSATWRALKSIPTGSTFTLGTNTTAMFNVSAVAKSANCDFLLNMVTSTGQQIGTTNQSLKTQAAAANYLFTGDDAATVALTSKTDTADVSATTGAYKKFQGDTLVGTATVLSVTNNSTATAVPASAPFTAKKLIVTLAGDFTGIDKIVGTGVTGCDATGDTTSGTAGEFLINADKTLAIACNTANVTNAGGALVIAPTFHIDGVEAQVARSFTAAVALLTDTNFDASTFQTATALQNIIRNGVSFVANSLGPLNTVKVTDRSGALPTDGGTITVTAWAEDGTSIPEDTAAAELKVQNNATTTISGADLAARFPTGTPMKYEFAVESSNAVVSNVKKTADGTNINVYTNIGGSI